MKISVIVAAYNVEKYIEECLLSILNQTYTNIELIVVNDGSTDNTKSILEQYALMYKNITVIHKKNGGLSSARNVGIEIATGEYLSFIDGDDYIKEDMYETLINLIESYQCDIAICGVIRKYENNEIFSDTGKILLMDKNEALKKLIESRVIHDYAVNKIYKKSLFKEIKYPEGKIYEDVFTTYKTFSQCSNIVYIDTPKYYYVQREGSILRSKFSENQFQHLEALKEINDFLIEQNYTHLIDVLELRKVSVQCRLIYEMLKNKVYRNDHSFDEQCKQIIIEVRKKIYCLKEKDFSTFNKGIIIMSILGFNFSCFILKIPFVKFKIQKKEKLL